MLLKGSRFLNFQQSSPVRAERELRVVEVNYSIKGFLRQASFDSSASSELRRNGVMRRRRSSEGQTE